MKTRDAQARRQLELPNLSIWIGSIEVFHFVLANPFTMRSHQNSGRWKGLHQNLRPSQGDETQPYRKLKHHRACG